MSTHDSDCSPDRELVISRQSAVKIEEINGRPVVRFSVDPSMQGHTFAVDISDTASEPVLAANSSSTRVSYHHFPSKTGIRTWQLTPDLERLGVTLKYADTKSPQAQRETALFIRGSGDVVQRLIVETSENDIETAIRHTGQIVADLLDAMAFVKRIPISIRHIEVHAAGRKYQRRYVTLPFGSRNFTADDLTEATTIPSPLKPALRLFREGLSSSKPHYRLLCLYRVREVLKSVRHENDHEVLARGMKPDRPVRILADNELTRCYFPTFVGRKVGAFLDYVQSACRLDIAHANLNEYFKLVLDPADVRTDHRVDFTNAALMPVIAELIRDEVDFMSRFRNRRIGTCRSQATLMPAGIRDIGAFRRKVRRGVEHYADLGYRNDTGYRMVSDNNVGARLLDCAETQLVK